jgi:GT2 family glycosyltransferase
MNEAITKRVWIILVNWRNGTDTLECLDSIVANAGDMLAGVAICDNDSQDDSITRIQNWAKSRAICLNEYEYHEGNFKNLIAARHAALQQNIEFVLIRTGGNRGFAGGNNVGIRYVQAQSKFDFILLLNNDATLAKDSLEAMVIRFKESERFGMIGCTVVYHYAPQKVQAYAGASFQPWLARAVVLGAHRSLLLQRDVAEVERQLDYIHGASLMIKRDCLEKIGLMEERYFLYYEEIDWAIRAKRCGFTLGYAEKAIVFHKEGGTIGSSSIESKRSLLSEYYLVRSAMRFTSKFYLYFIPTVAIFLVLKTLPTILRGDRRRAIVRLRALVGSDYKL